MKRWQCGFKVLVQHVRHRHFHPDEDVVEGDGRDPSVERHVDPVMSSFSPRHAPASVSLLASSVHPSPAHVLRLFLAP